MVSELKMGQLVTSEFDWRTRGKVGRIIGIDDSGTIRSQSSVWVTVKFDHGPLLEADAAWFKPVDNP